MKTLQDGPESVKEILWSEGPWLGEELEKAWENYYEVQGYSPFATCGNDQCRSKDLYVQRPLPCPPLVLLPLCLPLSLLLLRAPRCQEWINYAHRCTRYEAASPQVEAMQARHVPVYLKRLLSRTDES